MFGIVLIAVLLALIAYMFYKLSSSYTQYFEERNLKYVSVAFTLKNLLKVALRRADMMEFQRKIYAECPNEPVFGVFDFSNPATFHIRDIEMIKRIAIKDFDYFPDHRMIMDEKMDAVMSKVLMMLCGEEWHQMRATLSPAFTGNKMRQMFELISECADGVVEHLTKKAENGEKLNVELVDFFSRYGNDVIATCAFGLKVNSFADPENEFYLNGKNLTDFSGIVKGLKFFITLLLPKVARILNIKVFDKSVMDSFKNMILDTMEMRQKMNIYRPDMINMLMQVREGKLNHQTDEKSECTTEGFATVEESELGKVSVSRTWSDNEIVAQCMLFFIAALGATSITLSLIGYELTKNPEVQQKLYEEIVDVNKQLDGKRISYDTLQKMKYLDQVICEVLRLWPAAIQSDRKCVKDYIYDDGQRKFRIDKGSNVIFSIYIIHHDEKYYPDPEKFDPERFNDENKQNIVSGTYIPFSLGPRNCIGSRFALMELKAILYYLLLNFSFEVNKDTQIPLKLQKGLVLAFEKGIHVELKPRPKSE